MIDRPRTWWDLDGNKLLPCVCQGGSSVCCGVWGWDCGVLLVEIVWERNKEAHNESLDRKEPGTYL